MSESSVVLTAYFFFLCVVTGWLLGKELFCFVFLFLGLSGIKPKQLNSATPLVSTNNNALPLSSFIFDTECILAMKIALFPSGRRGPNENRLQKWKYEACAKILSLSEKLEQQNLIALKL